MCINRKLYNIATLQSVSITPESVSAVGVIILAVIDDEMQKRRNTIVDLCIGVLFPIIVTVLRKCMILIIVHSPYPSCRLYCTAKKIRYL